MTLERVDLGEVDYHRAVADMAAWADERRAGTTPDRLFLLSHPPVITYGRRTPPTDLPRDLTDIPAIPVDRGGNATGSHCCFRLLGRDSHPFPSDARALRESRPLGAVDITSSTKA